MSRPAPEEIAAQTWHQAAGVEHFQNGGYSSCWCCCTRCDPDWEPELGPNPHFATAQAAMRTRPSS